MDFGKFLHKKIWFIGIFLSAGLITILFNISLTSSSSEYFLPYAKKLANVGIITKQNSYSGYRLLDSTLRQEVLKIALKLNGSNETPGCRKIFTDVSDSSPNNWICKIAEASLVKGIITKNDKFRPEDKITRVEALAMIMRAKSINITKNIDKSSFDDVIEGWQKDITETALNNNLISKNKSFRPNDNITRGELFVIVSNIIGKDVTNNNTTTNTPANNITKTGTGVPYYFIAIHNEPFHDEYKREERLAAAYQTLKEMIEKADGYNIKYTLMFTAQWADYIAESEERKKELASWKANGHEIAAHHHETKHGNWDGYTNFTEEKALELRKEMGKKESYLGNMDDYYSHLLKIDSSIKAGCLNEEGNKDALTDKVIYATCAGFLNSGEVGVRIGDTEPKKAINDYILVGSWNDIERKWLGHYQVTTAERVTEAKKTFETINQDSVGGYVVHSLDNEAEPFYEFLDFLHSKDPSGARSSTVSEIIDNKLIPEKNIDYEILTKPAPAMQNTGTGKSANKLCGDGMCDAVEKANPNLCPYDCGSSLTGTTSYNSGIKISLNNLCGDNICDSIEKSNPSICPIDCK